MTHHHRRDSYGGRSYRGASYSGASYTVNDGPMLGTEEDYFQDPPSDDEPEYDANFDEDFNKLLDEENEELCSKEQSKKDTLKLEKTEDFHVGTEFWYQGTCKGKIKETKARLEDLSKLASYTCDKMRDHIKRTEQDHGTTFCRMDYSPRHPPLDRPWTNSWKFNCTLKCRETKSNHFHSSSCERIVLEHIDPNVTPDDYPGYIKDAVKLFEDFAQDATKNMSYADGKETTDVLSQKSMWTGIKVVLRRNRHDELMMIVRGKKMGPLVHKLKRYFKSRPEKYTRVISVYCINQQWSQARQSFGAEIITGVSKLKDNVGRLSIEYKAKTSVDFNAVEASKLAEIVEEYACLTRETTFLDIGCGFGVLSLMMSFKCESVIGVNTMHSANNEIFQAEEIKKYNRIDNASFITCNPEDLITKCSPFIKQCRTVAALNLSTPYGKNKHVMQAIRNMPSIWRVIVYGTFTKEFHRNINALIIEDHTMGDPFKPEQGCILDKSPTAETAFDIIIFFERKSLIDPKMEPIEQTSNLKVEKYEYGVVEKKEDKPCSSKDVFEEPVDFEEKSRVKPPATSVPVRGSDYVSRRDRPLLDSPPRQDHSSTHRLPETEKVKEKLDSRYCPIISTDVKPSSSSKDRSREGSSRRDRSRDRSSRKDRSPGRSSRKDRSPDRSSRKDRSPDRSSRKDRSRDRSSRKDRSGDRSSSLSTNDKSVDRSGSKNRSKEKSSDSSRLKNGHSSSTSRKDKSSSATREKSYDLSLVKNETLDPNGFDIPPKPSSPEKIHKKSSHSSKVDIFTAPKITVKKEFKFKYQSPPRESPMSPPQQTPRSPPTESPMSSSQRAPRSPPRESPMSPPQQTPRSPPRPPQQIPSSPPRPVSPPPVPPPVKAPILTTPIKIEPMQSCNREEDSEGPHSPPLPVPPPVEHRTDKREQVDPRLHDRPTSKTLLKEVAWKSTVKAEPMESSESADNPIFKVPLKSDPVESSEANCNNNIHQPIILKVDHSESPMSPVKQELVETSSNLQSIENMETPIHRPRAFMDDNPVSPPTTVPTSFGISVQSNLSYMSALENNSVDTVQIKKEKDADDSPLASVAEKPDEIPVTRIKSEVIDPGYSENLSEVGCENVPLPIKVKSEPIDSQDSLTQTVRVKNEPVDMDISPQGTPEMDSIQTPIHTSKALSDTPLSSSPTSSSISSTVDDSEFSVNTNSSYLTIKTNLEQPKASVNVKKEPSSTSSSSSEEEIRIVGEKKKQQISQPMIRVKTVAEIIKVKTEMQEAEDLRLEELYKKRQAILQQLGDDETPRSYKRQISSPSPPPRKYKRSSSPSLSPPRNCKRSFTPSPKRYSRSPSPYYSSKRRKRSPISKRSRRSPSPSGRRRKRSSSSPERVKKEPLSPPNYRRKERSKRSPSFNKREIYGSIKSPENSRWDRRKRSRSRSPRRR